MEYWITKDKKKLKPSEMEDSHILNAYSYFNKAKGFIEQDQGFDITDFCPLTDFQEEQLYRINQRLDFLKKEAKVRGLNLE